MKGRLPRFIEPHYAETALSVLCRLAEINHISPGQLATLSGFAWHDLRCGVDDAVKRLAEVSGASFTCMRKATPRIAQPRSYDWMGCRLNDNHIRSRALHVCPACIREDCGAGHHSPWTR
jgi:TniQ